MKANQEPVKEPKFKLGLNVQWGTKRHFSAKRRLKTISVNAEFRAQGARNHFFISSVVILTQLTS